MSKSPFRLAAAAQLLLTASFVPSVRTDIVQRETKLATPEDETCDVDGTCAANAPSTTAECGVWFAPSTIPGAGMGMFAGRYFQPKEEMTLSGDLVIPIIDMVLNQGDDGVFLWDEYTWDAESLLMDHEGLDEVNAASPGFGAAANCFLDLVNVVEWTPENNRAGLDRSKDPGAGAFTTYHNRVSTAKGPIEAGQELFVTYGSDWFRTREEQMGILPLKGDPSRANMFISKFQKFRARYNDTMAHIATDLWETFVMKSPFQETSRQFKAIPSSWEELEVAMSRGLVEHRKEQCQVPLVWLEEHGSCVDAIRVAPSTLPQAGRGAFLARFRPKDSVVAPVPLIHITERSRLFMYNVGVDDKGKRKAIDKTSPIGQQLLLNYCMGHSNSTLLLCPYGVMTTAVNHNRTLANIKLQWADPEKSNHHPDWLNLSISQLREKPTAGLAMEYIALRDILPGEELFLDYGEEWEDAWNRHVASWKPVDKSAEYQPAEYFNSDRTSPLRTEFDQMTNPYPGNVELKCELAFKNKKQWKKHYASNTIQHFLKNTDAGLSSCDLMRRRKDKEGNYWYTAITTVAENDDEDEDDEEEKEDPETLEGVPRDAFKFFDRPRTTDMHLPNAFRHEMMIPDNMFPDNWKNGRSQHWDERFQQGNNESE